MMRVGRRETSGIQVQDVSYLRDGLCPAHRWDGEELELDSRLMLAQQFCVDLHVDDGATDISRFLRGHPSMLVQLNRIFSHIMTSASLR
jgi:hypothetical protein